MGRVIHTQSGSRTREQAMKQMALAIRAMAGGNLAKEEQQDIGAFLVASLKAIRESVDQSAQAWEKRDYWVKADHFRMEWRWVERLENDLNEKIQKGAWPDTIPVIVDLAGKLSGVEVPKRIPSPLPWKGSWKKRDGKRTEDETVV